VGRSNRRAYAYLLVPSEAELTPLAKRRLSALKEFTELGSGFRVAALDMELRGAGNLLGGQQHCHVNAIGLELYCQLLEEAVRELRGEPARPAVTTTINLGLDIRIPSSYIHEEHQRLRAYKMIGGVRSPEELATIAREMEDRYGALPPGVRNLLDYASLKLVAGRLLVQSIERRHETVEIGFPAHAEVDPARLLRFVSARPGSQFSPSGVLRVRLGGRTQEVIPQLHAVLEQLQA
jgi:transcription-repair coupling factor (superfamily II helicase)